MTLGPAAEPVQAMKPETTRICIISSNKRCHTNSILSSRIKHYIAENGHSLCVNPGEADLILVNSCGVLHANRDFTVSLIKKALASGNKDARVACIGCLTKIDHEGLEEIFGKAVTVIENCDDLDRLIRSPVAFRDIKACYYDQTLYNDLGRDLLPLVPFLGTIGDFLSRKFSGSALLGHNHFRQKCEAIIHTNKLHILIGEGCAHNCHYCAIKLAKGSPRSRQPAEIIGDVRRVYTPGHTLHLVADDCGSYGADIGSSLFELVRSIALEFPAAPIDIRYLNPYWLGKYPAEHLQMFKDCRINSINICMQSGSDRLLRLMNRNYDARSVLAAIDELKAASPATLMRSHFIVGYPTETRADFKSTLAAAEHFHFFNTFSYSGNKGTESYKLTDDVPPAVKYLRRTLMHMYLWAKLFLK